MRKDLAPHHNNQTSSALVNKPLTDVLLLAAVLGLAASEKTPEDKMASAKESISEAMDNLSDAAKDTTATD